MIIEPNTNFVNILQKTKDGANNFITLQEDLAWEKYEQLTTPGVGLNRSYISIEKPKQISIGLTDELKEYAYNVGSGKMYIVEQKLTNIGEALYYTLKRKHCFNTETNSVDFIATEDFFQKFLDSNNIPEYVFEYITELNDPYLMRIKNDLIAFKLSANRLILTDVYNQKVGHWQQSENE